MSIYDTRKVVEGSLVSHRARYALVGATFVGLAKLPSVENAVSESSFRRPITVSVLTAPSASRWGSREATEVRIGVCTGGDHSDEVSGHALGLVQGPSMALIRIVIYSGLAWPLGAAGCVESPKPPAEVS